MYAVGNTIKNFNTKKDELITSSWLSDERKQVKVRLLCSSKNAKNICGYLNSLSRGKVKFISV